MPKSKTEVTVMTNNKTIGKFNFIKAKGQQKHYCKKELMLQKNENFINKIFRQICEHVFIMHVFSAALYYIPEEPPDKL